MWICILAVLLGELSLGALAQEAPAPAAASQPAATEPSSLWDDGIKLQCRGDWLSLRFGGKVQADSGWANGQGDAAAADVGQQFQWRRLRPFVSGTVADKLDFKIEAELTGPQFQWMDLYARVKDLPGVGSVTAGQFKEPFGLEQLTSDPDTTFLERALPDAFAPARSPGVMLQDSVFNERATWAVGLFHSLQDEPNFPNGPGGQARAVTGRATWLPWLDEQTDDLVHLGAAYSYRSLIGDARYRQRPEAHFVDYLTDTMSFPAEATHLAGAEAAWVHGPLSVQGEYMAAFVEREEEDAAFLHGAYVQASYFLTGEHRPYDRKRGVFEGPRPSKPFPTQGLGAWEVATRYSFLDLRSPGLSSSARQMQDLTVGLNWYLNPNVRLGWNYVHSWVKGSDSSGAADVFWFRIQLQF